MRLDLAYYFESGGSLTVTTIGNEIPRSESEWILIRDILASFTAAAERRAKAASHAK